MVVDKGQMSVAELAKLPAYLKSRSSGSEYHGKMEAIYAVRTVSPFRLRAMT